MPEHKEEVRRAFERARRIVLLRKLKKARAAGEFRIAPQGSDLMDTGF